MPEPTNSGAAEQTTTTSDPLAEAVNAAFAQVSGDGATTDSTPDEGQDGTSEGAADEAEAQVNASEDGEGDEGEGDSAGDAEAEAELYTADELTAMKPTQLYNLDLNRVPKELRTMVKGLQATFTRNFQELAAMRKESGKATTEQGSKADEGQREMSDEELYDLAMEGPAGFKKALQIAGKQLVEQTLAERGITPEDAEERQIATLLAKAEDIASETFPEIADGNFKKDMGAELKGDQVLARRLKNALDKRDADTFAMVLEVAAERVKSKRFQQTANARAAKKMSRETATATEKGSVAAASTAKGSPAAKSGGPVPLEDALADAIKQTGARTFR